MFIARPFCVFSCLWCDIICVRLYSVKYMLTRGCLHCVNFILVKGCFMLYTCQGVLALCKLHTSWRVLASCTLGKVCLYCVNNTLWRITHLQRDACMVWIVHWWRGACKMHTCWLVLAWCELNTCYSVHTQWQSTPNRLCMFNTLNKVWNVQHTYKCVPCTQ